MNTRKYHGTKISLASLGGESIIKSPDREDWPEARRVIREFLDAGGVLMDTSPEYTLDGHKRLSEKRFGEVLPKRKRSSFIICTKSEKRKRDTALRDLDESLQTLGLDYVDEWRLHHVDTITDFGQIFGRDGAIEAMDEALKDGRVKRASISSHNDDILIKALKEYRFPSVLVTLNIADKFLYPTQEKIIPYCRKRRITVTAMKLASRGKIFRHDGITDFQDCFNYSLSVKGVQTAIVGISNIEQLWRLIECDKNFKQLNEYEMKELEDKIEPYARDALYFRKGEAWPDDLEHEDMPKIVL